MTVEHKVKAKITYARYGEVFLCLHSINLMWNM